MPVILIPGHHFFTETSPVAPGLTEPELAGLAALAMEGSSPFPAEQLVAGYYGSAKANGLVAFAALRRKFNAEQDAWRNALFVVPDFATFLPRGTAEPRIVVLETPQAVTVMRYGHDSKFPERIVSRPVPAEPVGEEGVAFAREQALARLPTDGRRVVRYQLASVPCLQSGSSFLFQWEPVEGASSRDDGAAEFDAAEMWALDLRDADFLVGRRRDFQWNRLAGNALVGLLVIIGLLALGEAGLFAGGLWLKKKRDLVAVQTPVVQLAQDNNAMLKKLDAYGREKPRPIKMLELVNQHRHESILFTRFLCEGWQMKVSAFGTDVGQINALGTALRSEPDIANVVLTLQSGTASRTDFTLVVNFRPGFGAEPVPPPAAATAPVDTPPAPAASGAQPVAPETVTVQP